MIRQASSTLICLVATLFAACEAPAQSLTSSRPAFASNIIVPQARTIAFNSPAGAIEITGVVVAVNIIEQAAVTTMEVSLRNPGGTQQEAELMLPVPVGAAIRGFTFQGAGKEPSAQVLPKDEARRIYDGIVARSRDPALLEFVGLNLIRSSVFPVPARGTQKVRVVYEQVLQADVNRIDYSLPRSDSMDYKTPWEITVSIKTKKPISTVYSPSHLVQLRRQKKNGYQVKLSGEEAAEPGPFRLSYLLEKGAVTASMFAYPDPKIGGGYFLLLAAAPLERSAAAKAKQPPKEVTLVLDRSGSMHGEKIEQAREAALQVIAGLEERDYFNIIVYNEHVDLFAAAPVRKNDKSERAARKYLASVQPRGGTNIHDALLEALRQKPVPRALPMVLFLTDGLPTMGQTSEKAIREMAAKANTHQRRVFTFAVGLDVNVPLLESIAKESRGASTWVLPKEDVEVKVGAMFRRLAGPTLTNPELLVVDQHGKNDPGRVRQVIPDRLPDFFEGDQVVILGRYLGEQPLHFVIAGDDAGRTRRFAFDFAVDKATTRNGFVARQWAVRKIDMLVNAVRELGGDFDKPAARERIAKDPRFKELVEEIVRLSAEFGVLTEYTAFLAREGTDLAMLDHNLRQAQANFRRRALSDRSGVSAFNQTANHPGNSWQNGLFVDGHVEGNRASGKNWNDNTNSYFDANMNRVSITTVQQRNGQAFYKRGNRWVQSNLANSNRKPDRTIRIGSKEYRELVGKLAKENRQGSLGQSGEILLEVDGQAVLLH